jgi:tight adherence protein C
MGDVAISTALVFCSILLISQTIFQGLRKDSGRLRLWRIRSAQFASSGEHQHDEDEGILLSADSALVKHLEPVARVGPRASLGRKHQLRRRLIRAGYRRKEAALIYNAIRLIAFIAALGVFAITSISLAASQTFTVLGGVMVAISSYILPSVLLDRRIRHRQFAVEQHLPSAIDLLAISVDAGMGLNHALSRVGRELRQISPVFSDELRLVSMQTSAGKSNADALRGLAERVDSRDLSLFVNMLVQTERFGTNVSNSLRAHSEDMRSYRMQAAEERAGKATVRMLMPTSLIMLSLLIIIMGLGGIKASHLLE